MTTQMRAPTLEDLLSRVKALTVEGVMNIASGQPCKRCGRGEASSWAEVDGLAWVKYLHELDRLDETIGLLRAAATVQQELF